ncbi:hypothetical protein Bbelb_308080 [Branchiostoma belcheri]|nr:hypothetical protein Bbelb_308080 [Branchiostoma belcheri]
MRDGDFLVAHGNCAGGGRTYEGLYEANPDPVPGTSLPCSRVVSCYWSGPNPSTRHLITRTPAPVRGYGPYEGLCEASRTLPLYPARLSPVPGSLAVIGPEGLYEANPVPARLSPVPGSLAVIGPEGLYEASRTLPLYPARLFPVPGSLAVIGPVRTHQPGT